MPVRDTDLPRLFNEHTKNLPFVKDILNSGCNKLSEDAIVVFTNSDICVSHDASVRIATALQSNDACYAFRRDFNHQVMEPIPDGDISKGAPYPGSDLYAFRVGWWRWHRDSYPDMVFAREAWDSTLRVLIEDTNSNKPLSIPDLIYHERHANGWEGAHLRYTLAGQRHNLRLAKSFFTSHGHNPASFGVL